MNRKVARSDAAIGTFLCMSSERNEDLHVLAAASEGSPHLSQLSHC